MLSQWWGNPSWPPCWPPCCVVFRNIFFKQMIIYFSLFIRTSPLKRLWRCFTAESIRTHYFLDLHVLYKLRFFLKIKKRTRVSTGSQHKLPVRVISWKPCCNQDDERKLLAGRLYSCVTYLVPPSLNAYGTDANSTTEAHLRAHALLTDSGSRLLSLVWVASTVCFCLKRQLLSKDSFFFSPHPLRIRIWPLILKV